MFAWVFQVREVKLVVVARARAEQGRPSLPQIRGNVERRATYRIELSRRSGRCRSEHGHDEDQAGRARMPTIGTCFVSVVLRQLLGPVSWQMMPLFFH